jgi:hypothetical protein
MTIRLMDQTRSSRFDWVLCQNKSEGNAAGA